jgi:hypothetical protein
MRLELIFSDDIEVLDFDENLQHIKLRQKSTNEIATYLFSLNTFCKPTRSFDAEVTKTKLGEIK